MSSALGSIDLLKYASPRLRTCTISVLTLARLASATSLATCPDDLMPGWNASTHSARYWGAAASAWDADIGSNARAATTAASSLRVMRPPTTHACGRWLRSLQG